MPNPFYNAPNGQNGGCMTKANAVNILMQQALQMGSNNFLKQITSKNPQAQNIYNMLMNTNDPLNFYFNLMSQNGINKEQAIQIARQNGIRL